MQLIDDCYNQQNIFGLHPVGLDKTFVMIKWAINELKLSWTEQFETYLLLKKVFLRCFHKLRGREIDKVTKVEYFAAKRPKFCSKIRDNFLKIL